MQISFGYPQSFLRIRQNIEVSAVFPVYKLQICTKHNCMEYYVALWLCKTPYIILCIGNLPNCESPLQSHYYHYLKHSPNFNLTCVVQGRSNDLQNDHIVMKDISLSLGHIWICHYHNPIHCWKAISRHGVLEES